MAVTGIRRVWWKRGLIRAVRFVTRWHSELRQVDWASPPRSIWYQVCEALHVRDSREGDYYYNGWYCWPWNHSTARFKRLTKVLTADVALREVVDEQYRTAERKGRPPMERWR